MGVRVKEGPEKLFAIYSYYYKAASGTEETWCSYLLTEIEGVFCLDLINIGLLLIITLIMTWTKLFYVKNLEKAFLRVIPGRERTELPISKRYQAEIRKEFRMAGVPWIYGLTELKTNPRDIRPKSRKRDLDRVIRLDKI